MDLSNHCQFIGNLAKDPETRNLDGGNTVTQFTIATNSVYKNKQGEKTQDTQFHRIVAWGKLAEMVDKYFTKGMRVAVAGKLTHRSYESNGVTKYITEVVMSDFTFLGSSDNKGSGQGGQKRQTANTAAGEFATADKAPTEDPDDLPF